MFILLHLAGGVALLTWGLHMVESGFMRALGSSLRRFMASSLGNRFSALFAGLAVTAALQSATATGLIATSFAARRIMRPVTGLAIMLGANIGSTLIVQAFSLNLSWISPACLVVGMAMFERGKGSQMRDFGRAIIGLGLMLLALELLVDTMAPAEAAPALRTVLGALADMPALNAAIAALLTWAAHSSIPIVLFVMSLATSNAIPMSTAIAMVLGTNIGSALNPYFAGAKGNDNLRKRLPAGNLLLRGGVCLVLLAVTGPLADALMQLPGIPGHRIADFHTGLNIAIAVLFIGLLDPVARLLEKIYPQNNEAAEDPDAPRHLDSSAIGTPEEALINATREALHMGDIVEDMLAQSLPALLTGDRRLIATIARRDDAVDRLYERIKFYVTAVTRDSLDPEQGSKAMAIIAFVINMEHIGDIIDRNLMELAAKKAKNRLRFSGDGATELSALHELVLESFRRAMAAFMANDLHAAGRLLEDKVRVRDIVREAGDNHLARLREGRKDSISTSSLHLDVLRDFKRIHSHICAIAYPVIERSNGRD